MTDSKAPPPSEGKSDSLVFESQGSLMLHLAAGGVEDLSSSSEHDITFDSTSGASDIRLKSVRETQLEDFPSNDQSIHLDLGAFDSIPPSFPTPPRDVTTSHNEPQPNMSEPPRGSREQVVTNDSTRRVTTASPLPPQAPVDAPPLAPLLPAPSPSKPSRMPEDTSDRKKNNISFDTISTTSSIKEAKAGSFGRRHPAGGKSRSSLDDRNFYDSQEPRSRDQFQNALALKARAEEEAERQAQHAMAGPSRPAKSPTKRPSDENRIPSPAKGKGKAFVRDDDSSQHDDSSIDSNRSETSAREASGSARLPLAPTRLHASRIPKILVAATPTDTDTSLFQSSGISNPGSPPPPPLVSDKSDPVNPPYERPTSSPATSSHPFTTSSKSREADVSVEVDTSLSDQSGLAPVALVNAPVHFMSSSYDEVHHNEHQAPPPLPRRMNTPEKQIAATPAIPVTPTQQIPAEIVSNSNAVAGPSRLRSRKVDVDTLSRLRSASSLSGGAGLSLRASESEADELTDDDGGKVDDPEEMMDVDDGADVVLRLPSTSATPESSRLKGKGKTIPVNKSPSAPQTHSVSTSKKRKYFDMHRQPSGEPIPSPVFSRRDGSGNGKRLRQASPSLSPDACPLLLTSASKPSSNKTKPTAPTPTLPSSASKSRRPARSPSPAEHVESSPGIPLASLPNVTKFRPRKSSVRRGDIFKSRSKRPTTPPSDSSDDDANGQDQMEVDEEEASHAIADQDEFSTESEAEFSAKGAKHRPEAESDSNSDSNETTTKASSSDEDNSADEDYQYIETQDSQPVPGGHIDQFGVNRKRKTYASVSPSKSSRKRARLAATRARTVSESPTKLKPSSSSSKHKLSSPSKKRLATTRTPSRAVENADSDDEDGSSADDDESEPEKAVLRVFAPWHRDKCYYLGRVVSRTKKDEYTVLFDDGEESSVALSKLRSEVQEGDRVKIIKNPICAARWAIVKSVFWKKGVQSVTARLEKSGEKVTVESKYITLPKDTLDASRHISIDDIPVGVTKAIPSPLQTRAKSIAGGRASVPVPAMTQISRKNSDGKGKGKATPGVSGSSNRRRTSATQTKPSSASRPRQVQAQTSFVSIAGAESYPVPIRSVNLPLTQLKNAFANTILLMTGISDTEKSGLIPRIRRHGGQVIDKWEELLDFGRGYGDIEWKEFAGRDGKPKHVLLVASTESLSPKYMAALALGVPCVSIHWALHRANGVDVHWSGYLLASGESALLGRHVSQLYDPQWLKGIKVGGPLQQSEYVRKPFDNLGILMVFDDKKSQEREKRQAALRVICAAGASSAELVTSPSDASEPVSSYELVVTDLNNGRLHDSVLNAGAKACVGMDWIKQCVIMGAMQPTEFPEYDAM